MLHRSSPGAFAGSLLRLRVVRFALVGAVGIPVNVGLLWLFHKGLHVQTIVAWLWAFELSALLNFYANQRFTYREQTHVRGKEWLKRAFRAQISSSSGVLINAAVFGLLLGMGIRYLEADAGGIVASFFANFLIANRFVFTPARSAADATSRAVQGQLFNQNAAKMVVSDHIDDAGIGPQMVGVPFPAHSEPELALGASGSFVSTEEVA
ncbi:MAG: GtrA family protein [Chloroflexi bacterium]|nr:GtrA family protein [Chloroflexota bacterium]